MRIGSLFTGAGQLDRAAEAVLGGPVLFHVENDPAATSVLRARWPQILNLGDITGVDWTAEVWQRWPAGIDCLVGGFPCQDVSCGAADRRAGLAEGTRSGLWAQMARAVDELKPSIVVIEQVRGLLYARAHRNLGSGQPDLADPAARPILRAAGAVLGDLAALGFDSVWVTVPASAVGACHLRERVFILATEPGWRRARRGPRAQWRAPGPDLPLLPTPAASDATGGGSVPDGPGGRRRGDTHHHGQQLVDYALLHGSPRWARYVPAIARWEAHTREAPSPTAGTSRGGRKLNPAFSEWMLGWPPGWVTGVPGMRQRDALRIIGNGCCPQQAEAALRLLLEVIG